MEGFSAIRSAKKSLSTTPLHPVALCRFYELLVVVVAQPLGGYRATSDVPEEISPLTASGWRRASSSATRHPAEPPPTYAG